MKTQNRAKAGWAVTFTSGGRQYPPLLIWGVKKQGEAVATAFQKLMTRYPEKSFPLNAKVSAKPIERLQASE